MLQNVISWPLKNKNRAGISLSRVCILEKDPESLRSATNYKIYFPLFINICDIKLPGSFQAYHVETVACVHTCVAVKQDAVKKTFALFSKTSSSVNKESSSLRQFLVSVIHVMIEISHLNSDWLITRVINMICYVFGSEQPKQLMQITISIFLIEFGRFKKSTSEIIEGEAALRAPPPSQRHWVGFFDKPHPKP